MRTVTAGLSAVLLAAALAGCTSTGTDVATNDGGPKSATSPTSTTPGGGSSTGGKRGRITKLLVFVVENHSLDEMVSAMPYTSGLAQDYGYASAYTALTHPSLPNYLAMAGGDTFGVTDDDSPAVHDAPGQTVFGQALELGKTATLYAEGMPSSCALQDGGDRYVVKHNPWAYFADERDLCLAHDVSMETFGADVASGSLPNAGMVVPDLCNDAHDCDLGVADRWMEQHVGQVLAGPDFASGHLGVVITADEDDYSQDNSVLTTVIHPSQHGRVVDTPLTTYSLTRLYEQVLGAPPLGSAATAPDMAAAFALDVPGLSAACSERSQCQATMSPLGLAPGGSRSGWTEVLSGWSASRR